MLRDTERKRGTSQSQSPGENVIDMSKAWQEDQGGQVKQKKIQLKTSNSSNHEAAGRVGEQIF